MAVIKTIFKGESLSMLFTFPVAYDMARIEKHEVYIGETAFTGTVSGKTVALKLKSEDTGAMSGQYKVSLWIDDATLGVRKPYIGDIVFSNTNATPHNTSTSEVTDIIVPIVISETAVTVGDIMYNYMKGSSAYEVWLETHEGTLADYEAWLQQPATDAATAVNEAEALRVTAETTRVENEQGRVTAEITRQQNETLRIDEEDDRDRAEALRLSAETTRGQNEQARINAEELRVTAEGLRQTNTATAITNANNAATNANTKAGLADTAANNANTKAGLADTASTNANTKAGLANDAATLANTKAGLADTAATNANNARLAIQTDLGLKLDKSAVKQTAGTSETDVMSQKAVTDEINSVKLPLSEKTIPTTVGYIATPAIGDTVDYTVNSAIYQMRTITYDVVAGDEFIISGRGTSTRSLWMLIDSDNKVIVKETDDATINDKTVKVTQAGKLVVNTYMVSSGGVAINYYAIKSLSVVKKLETDKLNKSSVLQTMGQSTTELMSQKAMTDYVSPLIAKSNTNIRETTLLQHLNNPTIKTKIKFFGDSVTHGVGATGFSATGTDIPVIGVKRDLLTSPSYVNLFRNWINEHFNKEIAISPMYSSFVTRVGALFEYAEGLLNTPNTSTTSAFSSPFNGTKITVGFWKNSTNGIFDIYIDGVFNQSVDTYDAELNKDAFVEITVSDGNHTLEIRTTNNKNASSSGKMIVFTYLKVKKTVEVVNNGVTGHQSEAISIVMRTTTDTDDDFVFMMPGLNDRGTNIGAWRTGAAAYYIRGWLKANRPNAKMVLMSPTPVGIGQNANTIYKFQPHDIDMALRKAALDGDIPFISQYSLISKFLKDSELPSTKVLIDELHPNDFGHKMIFENILYGMGLSPKTAI